MKYRYVFLLVYSIKTFIIIIIIIIIIIQRHLLVQVAYYYSLCGILNYVNSQIKYFILEICR